MKIGKILNNNVVIVEDKNKVEKIVMGRGLAFKKKIGEEFDESKIDKIFILSNKDVVNKFQQLISDIPIEYIELGEELIAYASSKKNKKLNEMVYITLIDHIYASIIRVSNGITVRNVLLWDIKRFYPDEFTIGLDALGLIEKRFNIRLPDDEAGFIALHLVNAQLSENKVDDMYQITKFMQETINIVKYTFNIVFDQDSVYYYRFITHLKFFAQRIISKKAYEDKEDDELYNVIKNKYRNSYKCVENISDFILRKYNYNLMNEEKLYLIIHIQRMIYKSMK